VLVDQPQWLSPTLFGMAMAAILLAWFTWLQNYYLLRTETKLLICSSSAFLRHVFHLPVNFFIQRDAGEISARVSLNQTVASLLAGGLASNILNALMVVFYAFLVLQYDLLLTGVGIISVFINVLVLRWAQRTRVDENQRLLQDQGKLTGTAIGGIQIIETLKASGRESEFFSLWAGYQTRVTNAQQRLAFFSQLLNQIPAYLSSISNVLILGLGGFMILNGKLTMGELIAFQALMAFFTAPVNALMDMGTQLQQVEGGLRRLDDVLNNKVDPLFGEKSEAAKAISPDAKLEGLVEFQEVTFGYSPLGSPLLEDFSLTIRPGSRVAIVGESGSGKTTTAKLLAGLMRPWSGEILLDGKKRDDLPRRLITNSMAMVSQEIFLFEGTVKENLTLWDKTISPDAIHAAAKDAAIHDEIMSRPGGYEGLIAQAGSNFSGGQRQRLEIARALAGDPAILILDEAMSALDPLTEKIIDDNIRRRGCACLIVAHRLSTIRDCDEIIVLDDGLVVERGTHDELLVADGEYARLVKMG